MYNNTLIDQRLPLPIVVPVYWGWGDMGIIADISSGSPVPKTAEQKRRGHLNRARPHCALPRNVYSQHTAKTLADFLEQFSGSSDTDPWCDLVSKEKDAGHEFFFLKRLPPPVKQDDGSIIVDWTIPVTDYDTMMGCGSIYEHIGSCLTEIMLYDAQKEPIYYLPGLMHDLSDKRTTGFRIALHLR